MQAGICQISLLWKIARARASYENRRGNPNPLVQLGAAEIDLGGRAVYREGRRIDLTAREWALFEALLRHPGAILSKRQLEDSLYASESRATRSRCMSAA
jgi:two-component system OmpR family response regulator